MQQVCFKRLFYKNNLKKVNFLTRSETPFPKVTSPETVK